MDGTGRANPARRRRGMGFTEQDVLQYVEENDVKFIRLFFCDIFGVPKKDRKSVV